MRIVEEYRIKCPESYKSKSNEAQSLLNSLRKRIESANESLEANINKQRRDLEKLIPQIDQTVKDLEIKLHDPLITNPNSDIEEMVDYMRNLERDVS